MMKRVVNASIDAGYDGKLTLVSVRNMDTLRFYYDKVGMNSLKGGGAWELILTPESAVEFLKKY